MLTVEELRAVVYGVMLDGAIDWRNVRPVSLRLKGWTGSKSELRQLACAWYSEKLQGTSIKSEHMSVHVQFSSEGKHTAFATSGNLRYGWRAEMVRVLPELVKNAIKTLEADPDERRTKDTRKFHTLMIPILVNGKSYHAKITVREALNGPEPRHKFYDITALEIEAAR